MAVWQTSYVPGNWVVVSGSRAAVVMQPSASSHTAAVERALNELRDVSDLPTLTRRLLGWDPALLVDMLLVSDDDGQTTVLVRGDLKVHDAESGAVVANGEGGAVWQYPLKDSNQLRIDFGSADKDASWDSLNPGMVSAAALGINAGKQPVVAPWPVTEAKTLDTTDDYQPAKDATMVIPVIRVDASFIEPATALPTIKEGIAVTNNLSDTAAIKTPAAQVKALLAFSDGRVLPLAGPVVVGRSPQVAAGERVVPVKVSSPNHDVSRTHVRIEPSGDDEWLISDLNSTNGTLVRRPGESSVIATEGAPVTVGFGALIALGDNVVIRIDPVAAS